MPHVIVKLASGRTETQKQELADKIMEAVKTTVNNDENAISITIEELPQSEWKEQVYDTDIMHPRGTMYKPPGYTM